MTPFFDKLRNLFATQRHWIRRVITFIWVTTLGCLVGVPLYIYAVVNDTGNWFGPLPSLRDIENPRNDLSSEVISADGVSLGRYYRYNRTLVTFDELSPELVNTLITSEDHRFYEHSGMDARAYLRVIAGLLTFKPMGGGSTLTQQTAKNLFRTRETELQGKLAGLFGPLDLLVSKTKEWIIAVRLEENFTKEEIITMYLNTVPFNNNAYGIKVAAQTYFSKTPAELNYHESALLVGMLQGTSLYNPVRHPERATRKRNQVLRKLQTHGIISNLSYDSLAAKPLDLNLAIHDHSEGLAPYFTAVIRAELNRWCKERGIDLVEAGLKIHTTIDSKMQFYAEEAMKEHMARLQSMFDQDWGDRNPWVDGNNNEIQGYLARTIRQTETYRNLKRTFDNPDSLSARLNEKKTMRVFSWEGERDTLFSSIDSLRYYKRFLHAGLLSIEPETGAVKAWVGGIDHNYFKYDHVRQGARQPGSTFKPFVFGLAIENGYSPCHSFSDISPMIKVNGRIYQAKNSNGTYGDGREYTLRAALAKSLNSVTLQLMDKFKPANVVSFAKRAGVTSKLDPYFSLGLGTSNVTLFDMVGAYGSFVNQGVHIKPRYITRIEDQHGNIIEVFLPVSKQAMDPVTAYTMVHMLRGGVEEPGGTSQGLSDVVKSENEIGGKTGTTDNGSDGWYIGITPNLITGVWVGGDEPSIHFPRWGEGSGGKTAMPIWDKYMQQIYTHPETGYPKAQFKIPPGYDINLDCSKYIVSDSTFVIQ